MKQTCKFLFSKNFFSGSFFKCQKLHFYNLQVCNILLNLPRQEVHPDSTEYVVLPSMGKNACFLGPKLSTLLYLHVITGLLNSLDKKRKNERGQNTHDQGERVKIPLVLNESR